MLGRIHLSVIILGSSCCMLGCGIMQSAQKMTTDSMKAMKPRASDYRNTSDEANDEWSSMGGASRSLRPGQKENDPLRKWLLSPKARSIEYNLGVDDD